MNPLNLNDESQLFLRDKQAWENAIASYNGTDSLELWYNYICWFDYNLHIDPENKFKETLEKCLAIFEHNECYKQDIRMIKLWVKYVDLQPNPLKLYQILYQRGIGTQCSCFYIGWAHYYDSVSAFREAESVYNLGFQANAEPFTELQDSHTKFRLSVSQRMLYNDSSSKKRSANHLNEQRQQITTLNPPAKKLRTEPTEFTDHSPQVQQSSYTQNSNYLQTTNYSQVSNHSNTINHIQTYPQNQTHQQTSNQPQHVSHNLAINNFQTSSTLPAMSAQSQPCSQSQVLKHLQTPYLVKNSHSPNGALDSNKTLDTNNIFETNNTHILSNGQIPADNAISNHAQTSNISQSLNQAQTSSHLESSSCSQSNNSYNSVSSEQCNLNNSAYVISSSLNYIYGEANVPTTMEESNKKEEYCLQNVKIPTNFPRHCKNNFETWKPALCLEEPFDPNRRCIYRKDLVYPGDENEYSPEEIRSRMWATKLEELRTLKENDLTIIKSSGQKSKINHNFNNKSEEQIEASTIRFSTDADGLTKNKTITIKFRREKSKAHSQSNIESFSYSEDHEKAEDYTYTVEQVQKSHDYRMFGSKTNESSESHLSPSNKGNQRQTPKTKKIKRIKIVNNYDDPKYNMTIGANNSNTSSEYCNSKSTATISRNEYEDANLLLSFANVSSDSNVYTNFSNTQTSDGVSFNEDSVSNTDLNSLFNENGYLGSSNCSTPVRKLSQSCSKISTPQYLRTLKRHTSNISLQNDDSICSYEQNSFFAAEHDDDLKLKRLEKSQVTIDRHLAKPAIDPFSSELCKAFLTKLNFPSRDENKVYKIINTAIPKISTTKVVSLADVSYFIEKEVGRGSYGSVYKAINNSTGAAVALKLQKPPNTWELYICTEVRSRIKNYDILTGFMDISAAVIAPNASILITEFSVYGSLLDINNKIRQATKKVMHESLVMHFSSQILNIVSHLHSCKIIHADIKPDNFLLMKIPNSDSHIPSLRLIDFGCAIDMTLFPENTEFKKVIQTDGFTCIEMQEGKPWSYQTDLFCIAGTVHVMLFGEYMQLVKKFDVWDIKQKLPRYLKKPTWTDFFTKMLNIKNLESLPDLIRLKNLLDDEVSKMDSELQTQIRMLSNLLHRR